MELFDFFFQFTGFVSDRIGAFGGMLWNLMTLPNMLVLFGSTILGIIFGAMPGLTATLGVALLTTLTYGIDHNTAFIALLSIYVGAVYGGSYSAILLNIPGTAAAAATAVDGYPLALKGEGGRALGMTTTASLIGTIFGLLCLVLISPVIIDLALNFTTFEKFWLAMFGIIISGTLTSKDLVYKGWIAGLIGLWLSTIGQEQLQTFPRYTQDIPDLQGGIAVVPVLIGAFGIPQIIKVLGYKLGEVKPMELKRILPEFRTIARNMHHILRSSSIGVFIGAIPGIGEDIAGWVSYGVAKNTSSHPETFGKGEVTAVVSTECANNACIGGALIPLLTLGIPGSPPAAMLLGALMLHNVTPGPVIELEHPGFIMGFTAILLLAAIAMWISGMVLAKQVVKVLRIPPALFMPVIGVLCVIGSYSLGLQMVNLYLMVVVGIGAYFLTEMEYPIAPLVIGVILGPMADENLRRGLMVSSGDVTEFFTRPWCIGLLMIIGLTIASQIPAIKRARKHLWDGF
ncbi:MAG: tripartite tricarboxylate transporter permease, partial [Rhodospirillales bacterium]|nr:tripartite tricarboxylate transporter permease [Rhodospirillales bacterium]